MDDMQALAQLAGKTMFDNDPASQSLGMLLAEIRPGYARMTMPVGPDMMNVPIASSMNSRASSSSSSVRPGRPISLPS